MLATALGMLGLNQTAAKLIEFLAVAALIAGVTIYVMDLHAKAEQLKVLKAEHARIEHSYGCSKELEACLEEREKLAAQALAAAQKKSAAELAFARNELEALKTQIQKDSDAEDEQIDEAPVQDNGQVPKVLSDSWAKERARRGVK